MRDYQEIVPDDVSITGGREGVRGLGGKGGLTGVSEMGGVLMLYCFPFWCDLLW